MAAGHRQTSRIRYCSGATAAEVQEVEAMATRAVENHPNRPTIKVDRACEQYMFSDEKSEDLVSPYLLKKIRLICVATIY